MRLANPEKINSARCLTGEYASAPLDGFNGAFKFKINGLTVCVMASDGEGWEHVSVSIVGSRLPPSWSVMCQVKEYFWGRDVWVMQFHPPEAAYVNEHPGCLHLWRPVNQTMPVPPVEMV
jgi:hypothetical protein